MKVQSSGHAQLNQSRTILLRFVIVFLAISLVSCVTPVPRSDTPVAERNIGDVQTSGANGETVRWGGTIAKVDNVENGTLLQIVSRPLSSWGRPLHNDQSAGRFIAQVDGFLDPVIMKAGKDVTVLGMLTELRQGKVGETAYSFPVVTVSQLKMWKPRQPASPYYDNYWRHDFWHDWPFGHHRPHGHLKGAEGRFTF